MKRKGINIWEEHLERIVLGVAVLFVIGFGGWQLTRSPNEVQDVGPGEVDKLLRDTAEQLRARLEPSAPPTVDIPDHEDQASRFIARLDGPVSPIASITPTDRMIVLSPDGGTTAGVLFVEPSLPSPFAVGVQAGFDALDPSVVSAVDGLPAAVMAPPHDVRWNTVAAVVDLAAIRAGYEQADGDRRPIPANWYRNRLEVLDVVIEREQQVDGEWTDRRVILAEVGRTDLRDDLDAAADREVRDRILDALDDPSAQREIVQPEFYDTLQDSWLAFDPRNVEVAPIDENLGEDARRILREQRTLEDQLQRRIRIAAQLDELGQTVPPPPGFERPEEEKPAPPPGGGGGAGPPPGGGGAPGAGGSGRRPPGEGGPIRPPGAGGIGASGPSEGDREEQDRERRIERLNNQITRIDQRIERSIRTLQRLGFDPGQIEAPDEAQVVGDPLVGDELVVWGHDLETDPGAVYRYRVQVVFYNPFFRRKLDLLEEQHPLADGIGRPTSWSDWSEPQRTLEEVAVFVTDATPDDGPMGLGRVAAEVFRFTAGRWWREKFTVEPGHAIGQPRSVGDRSAPGGPIEVDFSTGWHLVDVLPRAEADRAQREQGLGGIAVLVREGSGEIVRQDPSRSGLQRTREDLIGKVEDADARALDDAIGGR